MGHNVGDAAARSVKKSEKSKLLERTPEEIIKDIRINLAAKLAVTPDDVRFLLAKYDAAEAAVAHLGEASAALLKRAETAESETKVEYHVPFPKYVGDTVRIISEVGDVNVVGDVKGGSDAKTE